MMNMHGTRLLKGASDCSLKLQHAFKSMLKRFQTGGKAVLDAVHSDSAPITDMNKAAIYVHWPFCRRRCTYCNFNKYINQVNHGRMKRCLQQEATTLVKMSTAEEITSVFFGGGTPSLAEPQTIGSVLETVATAARLTLGAEISMEINPTDSETKKLRDFKLAGVNRASIGVQTLSNAALRLLGREHNASDSLRCLETASDIFNEHTSVDLMFGYPGQSLELWRKELLEMLAVCGHHISLYQLTLERGTQLFKDVAAGLIIMPSPDEVADMYLAALELLASHGYEQYEVSNFAKQEHYCQHNISYWTGLQYIGIGPGSHGRIWTTENNTGQRHACIQTLEPENWMWEVEKFGHATRKSVTQTTKEILEELVSVGLRTKWGLCSKNWSALLPSVPLAKLFKSPGTDRWIKSGHLKQSQSGLQATPQGLVILDSILPDILLDIDALLT
ncbi:radical S-adenosyl methionine domain-containing protein 1, mitochondrial-like isoform X2 [Babylonia areolata]|uniref:radical S-adenosyl methionine domain-containing protein 1, mitochondrial-like isoform X2 n=1 Tax=Babylonia areolata TaxID=304850 RepID=UPI003FD0CF86